MFFEILAQQGSSSMGSFLQFLPIVLILGIFYLLTYRPMKTRQKNHESLLQSLKNGDKVITSGGVHGTVAGVRETTVLLKVSDQVKIEFAKSAVASLRSKPEEGGAK